MTRFLQRLIAIAAGCCWVSAAWAQPAPWAVTTFPDEAGYQRRIAGMLPLLAAKGYGLRSMAEARCPDSGKLFRVWALEGEEVVSPFTGRRFRLGPVGYFGPRARDVQGRITAFGGDPLKYDLPPATAALCLDTANRQVRTFLSIPGNLNQQYHFAAKNWARFYGLHGLRMDTAWRQSFYAAVAGYAEKRRPSDGAREHAPMSTTHTLVGEPGHLLGGNPVDGGTENHKTMWRTSALLYAQLFPDTAQISGHIVRGAEQLTSAMLGGYLQRMAVTGNGEYDSQTYYPHSIGGYLNLFDFSPNTATRTLAHATLDYYLATYGLKVVDGTVAGAQKRGFLGSSVPGEMELLLWTWGAPTSRGIDSAKAVSTIQQITSNYRPNKVLWNILNKKVALPFEARINRPSYHMDKPALYQETFYCSQSFGMGSVAMSAVDNPAQQVVWSLVAAGTSGPLCVGGGQPMWLNPAGHSPYTQTLQQKGALLLVSGPTDTAAVVGAPGQQTRRSVASAALQPLPAPPALPDTAAWNAYFENARRSAATWLYLPAKNLLIRENETGIFVQAHQTFIYIRPLAPQHFWLRLPAAAAAATRGPLSVLQQYQVLVSAGKFSGFAIEAAERSRYGSIDSFMQAVGRATTTDTTLLAAKGRVAYRALSGDVLTMQYEPAGLRCSGSVNGKPLDYNNWAGGAVYQSPYVQVANGLVRITDGQEGYQIDCRGPQPVFGPWLPHRSKKNERKLSETPRFSTAANQYQ